jgi:glucan phosphoethanolaminetransferase (alkaline phosphatase superfamily)
MSYFVEILAHTPFWVWIVLTALMVLGLGATRPRSRSYVELMTPSLIFTVLAIAKLAYGRFETIALFGTLIGGGAALVLFVIFKPARDTQRLADGRYMIKGEWMTFVIIMAVFIVNYTDNAMAATTPDMAASTTMMLIVAATNGYSALFSIFRTVAHLRTTRQANPPVTQPLIEA